MASRAVYASIRRWSLIGFLLAAPSRAAPLVLSGTLPAAVEMTPYSASLSASGGVPPYQWSVQPAVTAWGLDDGGQLQVAGEAHGKAAGISAGLRHTAIRMTNGNVSIIGTFAGSIPGAAVASASGGEHVLAVREDGTVEAAGDNTFGQCAVPSNLVGVAAVSAGARHSVALLTNGTVRAWGDNAYGQLAVPPGLAGVRAVAAGGFHTLALRTNGTVVAWGYDGDGQAAPPVGLTGVTAVAAGAMHSLALRGDGSIAAWGWNGYGQAGPPAGMGPAIALAAGGHHSLALLPGGRVQAWGDNGFGQTNAPPGLEAVEALAGGAYHSVAMLDASHRLPWGLSAQSNGVVSGTAEKAGTYALLVTVRDSTGAVTRGTVSLVVAPHTNRPPLLTYREPTPKEIMLGEGKSLKLEVLATDPEAGPLVYAWTVDGIRQAGGERDFTYVPEWGSAGLHTVGVSVSDGLWTNVWLTEWRVRVTEDGDGDGMADAWEQHYFGTLERNGSGDFDGDGVTDLAEWTAGSNPAVHPVALATPSLTNGLEMAEYTVALAGTNGSLPFTWVVGSNWSFRTWGWKEPEALPIPENLSHVTAIAAGGFHHLALRGNGTVAAWGNNAWGQANPSSEWIDLTAISAGGFHSLALRTGGVVVAWGDNTLGQCSVPGGMGPATAVAAGGGHSLALLGDGTVRAWGDNREGQSAVPPGLSNVVAVSAGAWHSLALRSNGTVRAWGFNGQGQTNTPPDLSNVVAIAAGYWHNLALRSNGTVVAWGWNESGQTNVPPGLGNVAAVAAGGLHSLVLRRDGTATGWGDNRDGQLDIPAGLSNLVSVSAGLYHSMGLQPYRSGLPEGMTCGTDGTLQGTPLQAGHYHLKVELRDGDGGLAEGVFEWVIQANSNQRPVISALTPGGPDASMGEATQRMFRITASDPENAPLTYAWTWNGSNMLSCSNACAKTTAWGEAGVYTLRCDVADNLWTNVVFAEWRVTVLADNDGDGLLNWQELELLRNPHAVEGGAPATLAGTVRGRGLPLTNAVVELRGLSDWVYQRAASGPSGAYQLTNIPQGRYYLKAGAPLFRDAWYNGRPLVSVADACPLAPGGAYSGYNFDLACGQGASLVRVESTPTGASVYLDFQDMYLTTPAILDLGETGERDSLGFPLAKPLITVRKDGYSLPAPVAVDSREAETLKVRFTLSGEPTGALNVETDPPGAWVYLDALEGPGGWSPYLATGLATGTHVVLVWKEGYLQARPLAATVTAGTTNSLSLELTPGTSGGTSARVHSVPPWAWVGVNYLYQGLLTDVEVDGLDPASNSGPFWQALTHTVSVRRDDCPRFAPRCLANGTNEVWVILPACAGEDGDGDGLPDVWEEAYGLNGQHGAEDDPDGDGADNAEELAAGTDPLDPESVFRITDVGWEAAGGGGRARVEFRSVPGRIYEMHETPAPGAGVTTTSGVFAAGQERTAWYREAAGASNLFFRVLNIAP